MKYSMIIGLVSVGMTLISHTYAADTSIIDALNQDQKQNPEIEFKLKTFNSCENFEDVMGSYIKDYWKNNQNNWYRGGFDIVSFQDDAAFEAEESAPSLQKAVQSDSVTGSENDFSKTNTQVEGVDESDIIKTDGNYIYYYNSKDKQVYIIHAQQKQVVNTIKIPKNFYNPVLYLGQDRLTILSSGYHNGSYNGYWIDRNTKTYTIVFDTSNISELKLLKLHAADGSLQKSRKIGEYIYVISNNYFNIPYYNFEDEADINVDMSTLLPKQLDISRTSDPEQQNLKIKGKEYPYSVQAGNVAKCSEIEYILPDEETIKKLGFNPSYNIISVINTQDTSEAVSTKVIAGSNSEIYMSQQNLYMTSGIYTPSRYSCPLGARCIMPFIAADSSNTLIHKLEIDGNTLTYQDSNMIPGSPLTQYAMDEKDGYFRIITSSGWGEESTTDLYILDTDLDPVSSLNGLGQGERFQSSRFMGDKLFLVTFEQIDPFYAIDLSDQMDPKVLGELKIPGFSTYLHPYDDTHIIGLGFDTTLNQWGGTSRNGLKLDLYKINYDKKCGDTDLSSQEVEKCASGDYKGIIVEQKYSQNFGESNSYSEATNNPRMFMWNAAEKTLLLPATLYSNYEGEQYRYNDYFNGMLGIKIDKDTGISEQYRLTHIDTSHIEAERLKECSQYSKAAEEPVCHDLIGGGQTCQEPRSTYVPQYCYADATIGEYMANRSWQYSNSFIKRALWIGDQVYTLSDNKMGINTLESGSAVGEVLLGEQDKSGEQEYRID